MNDKFLSYLISEDKLCLKLIGDWNFKIPKRVTKTFLKIIAKREISMIEIDFKGVLQLDYAIAIFIKNSLNESKKSYNFLNLSQTNEKIFSSINKSITTKTKNITAPKRQNILSQIGKNVLENFNEVNIFLNFLGEYLVKFFRIFISLNNLRIKEILAYFQDAGIKSVFIVCLTSFLIGIVLAYQGYALLSRFGASIVIVEMMGVLTLREIAPLIAAIIVAGRLASSFTAQIGVMNITEEIDAMKTMGFDPFKFLVLPRIIALIIAMPLIVFLADMAGIFGEMVVINNHLNVGFESYLERFQQEVAIKHLFVGLAKAPFFGIVIAFIGCWRGFEIGGDTVSVGRYTTISVVNAIFGVIAVDALFSILFTKVGI